MKPDLLELRYKRPTQKEKGHRQIILFKGDPMKPDLLELRYKRPTQKEKGHRQIILKREGFEDQILGYLIKDMDLRGYMRWYVCWDKDVPHENTNFKGSNEGRRYAVKYIAQTLKREGRAILTEGI